MWHSPIMCVWGSCIYMLDFHVVFCFFIFLHFSQVLRYFEIFWVFLRLFEIFWAFETFWDILRYFEMFWDIFKNYFEIFLKIILRYFEIFWDFLRFFEIFWDFLRYFEIFWDFLRYFQKKIEKCFFFWPIPNSIFSSFQLNCQLSNSTFNCPIKFSIVQLNLGAPNCPNKTSLSAPAAIIFFIGVASTELLRWGFWANARRPTN